MSKPKVYINRSILSDKKAKICLFAVYGIFAAFYLWMASCIPYTHDDWDWGLPVGLEQLLTANLNARYVGNFFVVIMTRSEILKTLIMGACCFLIPYITASLADCMREEKNAAKRLRDFLVCNVLLLSVDRWIWRQTYGWVSGFANFVISGVFVLLVLQVCLPVFGENLPEKHRFGGKCLYLLLLGVAGQLFLENVAVFLFGFVLVTGFVYRRRMGKVSTQLLFLQIGTLLGLMIMFSSGLYRTLWSSGSAVGGYRKVFVNANAGLGEMLLCCIRQAALLPYRIGENNLIIVLCILAVLGMHIWCSSDVKKPLRWLLLTLNGAFIGYFIVNHRWGIMENPLLLSILNCLYLLLCVSELWILFYKKKWKLAVLLTVWASAVAVVLPIVVTNEIGPRLFFTANLFSILFVVLLAEELPAVPAVMYRAGAALCVCAAVILVLGHGKIYYEIGRCKAQWNGIMEQSAQAEQIVLPDFPHLEYLWHPDPNEEGRTEFFKEFYGLPKDADIQVVQPGKP